MSGRGRKVFSKVLTFAAAGVLSLSLWGCSQPIKITTGLKDDVIFRLSDEKCSMAEIMITLINEKNQYEKDFGAEIWDKTVDGVSMQESIKKSVRERQVYLEAVYMYAKSMDIVLTDEEKTLLSNAAKKYFGTLTDKERELTGAEEEDILNIYKKNFLAEKVYEEVTDDVTYEVSDEEARVMSVMYIYVSKKDGTGETDINEAYKKVQSGTDFYSLALEYSDDAIVQLEIGRGDMVPEVEDKVFGLKDGECTDIIEADNGYYIVRCVEDYLRDKTDSNKEKILQKKKNDEFLKKFEPFMEKQRLDFNDREWDKVELGKYTECKTDTLFDVYGKLEKYY